jgi:nucleoside-diphosphate-sugar epimerase
VYGTPETLPIPEDHRLAPTTVLGKAKKAAEDLVSFYADYSDNKRFTILRLFNAYGPGQKPDFLIPTVLRQLDKPEIELGDTASRRDFVYRDDVVEAIAMVLLNPRDPDLGDARLRIFNVGSGSSHSPAEIVDLLGTIVGRQLRVIVDRQRLRSGEANEERADVRRLTSLGWQPRVDLKTGLELTWRSFDAVRA